MPAQTPHYILFAGINGVGKSTLFHSGMWENGTKAAGLLRVNSDEILLEQGGDWTSEPDQIRAGREAVRRVHRYLETRQSFNQETTLAGRSIMRTLRQAKEIGFRITMHYVGIESPELAHDRILHRVQMGGHGIDKETILRRFDYSMDTLMRASQLCDCVCLYDNTFVMRLVARIEHDDLSFYDLFTSGVTWHNGVLEALLAT